MNGIYAITYRGAADWGMGLLLFLDGNISGADIAGGTYDGSFSVDGNDIKANIILSVPPGVALVQGIPPQANHYQVPFGAIIPKDAIDKNTPVLIDLPVGPVNVIFKRLRYI